MFGVILAPLNEHPDIEEGKERRRRRSHQQRNSPEMTPTGERREGNRIRMNGDRQRATVYVGDKDDNKSALSLRMIPDAICGLTDCVT